MFDCTASIVTYNTSPEMIRKSIASVLSCKLNIELHIVDNSESPTLESELKDLPVRYHYSGMNMGYGRGNNLAIKDSSNSNYHIIINPDVIINTNTIEKLKKFMDEKEEIGIVCPKVLNPDGTIQYLNKRYPTILDLFIRRFTESSSIPCIQRRIAFFEMKDIGYESICDVEFTTGCFMFCRKKALIQLGGFDERYFLHFEDCDLGRMMHKLGLRTVYFPDATITHEWGREPHKNPWMAFIMIKSMFKYFNKWGWKFF